MRYPIVIPSRGRAHDVLTLNRMPKRLWRNCTLFVPKEEFALYYKHWGDEVHDVVSVTDYSHTISQKRHAMAKWVRDSEYSPQAFFMFDDDLKFFRRNEYDYLDKLETEDDWADMFDYCEGMFESPPANGRGEIPDICAVGISLRQGNNQIEGDWAWNIRMIRAGLYDTEKFLSVQHDRLRFMGDFDVLLQMMERGWDNLVVAKYAQDHRATNQQGGCAVERNEEVMSEVSQRLSDLHPPGVVKVVEKENKHGKMRKRKDVVIYWKKARKFADR